MGDKLHIVKENYASFMCPGCGEIHAVHVNGAKNPHNGAGWTWNGSLTAPTLSPSLLVRSGHYVTEFPSEHCWCTYNAEHKDDPAPFKCGVCHSFVRDGMIQFLGDCTHDLKNQTVEIPDWSLE